MNRCLGRLPTRHDPRTLKFAHYLDRAILPHVPDAWDYHAAVTAAGPWGVLGNDNAGDCAEVSPLHQFMALTANAAGRPVAVSTEDALGMYSAITGYVPGNPATDNGTDMMQVEQYLHQVGFKGITMDAYVSVDVNNPEEVKAASWMMGGLRMGFGLPAAWKSVNSGGVWKGPLSKRDLRGQWAAGSWGGHAVYSGKRTPQGHSVVTWGGEITCSDVALADYCDTLFVGVSRAWFDASGHCPGGAFDWETLYSHLADVSDGKVPVPADTHPPTPPAPPKPPAPPGGKLTVTLSLDVASRTGSVVFV